MIAAILIAGAMSAAPSVIPDSLVRFDLVCSGQARTLAGPPIPADWTRTYSVDLAAARWCDRSEGCDNVHAVAGVRGDIVILQHISGNGRLIDLEVSRSTGALAMSFDLGRAAYLMKGDCHTAPFEPIDPAPGD